jgi:hypothetical protein
LTADVKKIWFSFGNQYYKTAHPFWDWAVFLYYYSLGLLNDTLTLF